MTNFTQCLFLAFRSCFCSLCCSHHIACNYVLRVTEASVSKINTLKPCHLTNISHFLKVQFCWKLHFNLITIPSWKKIMIWLISALSLISPPRCFRGTFRLCQHYSGQNTICLHKKLMLGLSQWLHLCYDQFCSLETGLHLSLQVNCLCWARSLLPGSVALEVSPAVSVLPFLRQQQLWPAMVFQATHQAARNKTHSKNTSRKFRGP